VATFRDICEVQLDLMHMHLFSLDKPDAGDLVGVMMSLVRLLSAEPEAVRFSLQHLVPWTQTKDPVAACEHAATGLLGPLAPRSQLTDFAALADLKMRERDGRCQVEFGVVGADEASLRFGRLIGRAVGPRPIGLTEVIVARDYPPVATFLDSNWIIGEEPPQVADLGQWVKSLLGEVEKEAAGLAATVHDRLTAEAKYGSATMEVAP
jgi:hypothetical protein